MHSNSAFQPYNCEHDLANKLCTLGSSLDNIKPLNLNSKLDYWQCFQLVSPIWKNRRRNETDQLYEKYNVLKPNFFLNN